MRLKITRNPREESDKPITMIFYYFLFERNLSWEEKEREKLKLELSLLN